MCTLRRSRAGPPRPRRGPRGPRCRVLSPRRLLPSSSSSVAAAPLQKLLDPRDAVLDRLDRGPDDDAAGERGAHREALDEAGADAGRRRGAGGRGDGGGRGGGRGGVAVAGRRREGSVGGGGGASHRRSRRNRGERTRNRSFRFRCRSGNSSRLLFFRRPLSVFLPLFLLDVRPLGERRGRHDTSARRSSGRGRAGHKL